jgi:NAD(P)-dependent dehydrogenase (short-subunit alcohol dehydrogenase family)
MPDRVVVVTGASRGIGRAIAEGFARLGDILVVTGRDETGLTETARRVDSLGGEAVVVPTDVTSPDQVATMAEAALAVRGRIDVVVANAGIGGPSGVLWEIDPADWRETFAVNVEGVYLTLRTLLPPMLTAGSGAVVVVGSISGKRPLYGRSPYTASKMALVGLVRTLAVEAGPYGIRVNLVSPGFVEGPRLDWVVRAQSEARGVEQEQIREEMRSLSPLRRLTQAGEVADAVVFLASERARAITGADLNVNSGVVMY